MLWFSGLFFVMSRESCESSKENYEFCESDE